MKRFNRSKICTIRWEGLKAYHVSTDVKPGDLVVAEGTRGKYYKVLAVDITEDPTDYVIPVTLTLTKMFDGNKKQGLVRSRGRPFRTNTGWYKIIKPCNEEVMAQVEELCKETQ